MTASCISLVVQRGSAVHQPLFWVLQLGEMTDDGVMKEFDELKKGKKVSGGAGQSSGTGNTSSKRRPAKKLPLVPIEVLTQDMMNARQADSQPAVAAEPFLVVTQEMMNARQADQE